MVRLHVPAATMVAVLPETVHTAGAVLAKVTGSTDDAMKDGTKLTVYFRKPSLREEGVLPRGGIARFYGTAKIYKSGPVYEEVWRRLVQPEKNGRLCRCSAGYLWLSLLYTCVSLR